MALEIGGSDQYDEKAQQEKSFTQQVYEFFTEGTPIDLGGGGVDPITGETTNRETQTSDSDSDSGVTVEEATQLVEAVTEAPDPLEAFNEWMTSTFEDSQIRLSPKTISQIQYMTQMMLGRAQYSPLTLAQIQQEYGETFAYNEEYGVYVYQPSGGGDPTILIDDGTGNMVYASFDEATGAYTATEQPFKVLSGYDGTGILSKEWAKTSGVMDGILNHLFGRPGENGERQGGVFAKLSSAADGSIKVKTGQNIYDANGRLREGYALVPGTQGTTDSYTFNGEPIQVDADGNVVEDSTVYDRVESVISDLLGEGGAIELAEQDIQNVRDMGQAIADIGDRFGAYTTDESGNPVYNPNSFESRYAAYENKFTGEGGIASQYQKVLNNLKPYEELSLDLADDYKEVGAQYREMFNESRKTSPYTQWQDLLYAGAAENVNQGAEGARETLNTQYAQAGVNPNSPAYTAALMELEKNRTASLQQARRQAAVDSFNMGAQAMSNSASLLGGVERSLAGRGTAYGMGINTLLSEGNLISNKANALMQGVGLLGQQAGSALQQADLYNTSAGTSANAANLQLGAAGQALNFANAGVGNVGNYLQNQLAANNPYITMAPLVTNYGQSILNSINTLQSGAAQTSGDIDVSNATNNIVTSP